MFDKIFVKRLSLKSQKPLDDDGGVSQSGSGHEASNRVAKAQNTLMGACPLEDPDSGDKASARQSTSSKQTTINSENRRSRHSRSARGFKKLVWNSKSGKISVRRSSRDEIRRLSRSSL